MKDEVLRILAEECGLAAIPALSDSLSDLDADSVDIICAVNALEDRFDIEIPLDGNTTSIETVEDIVTMVEELVAGKSWR